MKVLIPDVAFSVNCDVLFGKPRFVMAFLSVPPVVRMEASSALFSLSLDFPLSRSVCVSSVAVSLQVDCVLGVSADSLVLV